MGVGYKHWNRVRQRAEALASPAYPPTLPEDYDLWDRLSTGLERKEDRQQAR